MKATMVLAGVGHLQEEEEEEEELNCSTVSHSNKSRGIFGWYHWGGIG